MFAATRHIATAGGISVVKGSVNLGATGSLTIPNDTALQLGSGDFTVESWWYVDFAASANQTWFDKGWVSSGAIVVQTAGTQLKQQLVYASGTGSTLMSVIPSNNAWHHIALVRSSGTLKFYLDGASAGSASNSTNFNNTSPLAIGSSYSNGYPLRGYISNFRIVKGVAVYTSDFTPPTTPLTVTPETTLLTCQSPTTITDASTNAFTITARSGAAASSVSPFA